jgi:hypothetical protein
MIEANERQKAAMSVLAQSIVWTILKKMLLFIVFLFKNTEHKYENLQCNYVDPLEPRRRGSDQVPEGGGPLLRLHPARASTMEMLSDCSQVTYFHWRRL